MPKVRLPTSGPGLSEIGNSWCACRLQPAGVGGAMRTVVKFPVPLKTARSASDPKSDPTWQRPREADADHDACPCAGEVADEGLVGDRAERRLAAILMADIAGYSRLVGADEHGTLEAWRAHWDELIEPTLLAHAGRVARVTGDGILAEFASVVKAARC